jgi:hypothetical protein
MFPFFRSDKTGFKTFAAILMLLIYGLSIFAAIAHAAGTLTYVTKARDAKDREYTAYLDLSTKHMEGTYTVMTSYALWDPPITSDGYSGIKWYKNVLQMDCKRNVKRLTYIGYLDVDGKVIVEESYPDAKDEAISTDRVDAKEKPFYCGQ